MLEALDAAAVLLWSRTAVQLLDEHRLEIDELNVFPVPDADTGSNTLTTLRAGRDAVIDLLGPRAADSAVDPAAGVGDALAALSAGAADAALGNSGFIVSQILRGLADAAADGRCGHPEVAAGLVAGAQLARSAVVSPVEGTILTVADAAAAAAIAAALRDSATLAAVVVAAVKAADDALQRTPSQLAELAQAGVVDAGGRALVVLLDALARAVTGASAGLMPVRGPLRSEQHQPDNTSRFGFEVQYHLDAPESGIEALRKTLADIGDSVAVVSVGVDRWNVHVHVDDVGAAIEAGVEAGRPHHIAVTRFHSADDDSAGRQTRTAVLAVAPGVGLAHLFESEGVVVVEGGAEDRPEAPDVLAAIHASQARSVVLLQNVSRVRGVAEAAAQEARAEGIQVAVVPTRSPVQGLAAIAVHDDVRRFDDDVVAMAEAAAATRWAELSIAPEQALTAVGVCQPGDILGMIDGEVVEIGHNLLAVSFNIVDRLVAVGAELITVVVGEHAPRRTGEILESHVRGRSPFTDVTVYEGGQPGQPVIIGVE